MQSSDIEVCLQLVTLSNPRLINRNDPVELLIAVIAVLLQTSTGNICNVRNHHETPVVTEIVNHMRTQNQTHGVALTFLQRYHDEDNEQLKWIITGGETDVHNCRKLATLRGGRLLCHWT